MAEGNFDEKQYVIFKLGVEVFGLEINTVKEIIVYQETTHIPGTSKLVDGIINLRGRVIPIFNLRRKFGFPDVEQTRSTRIVVVEAHDNTVGIVVDGVSEVLMISGNVIEKPSEMITSGVDASYIAGVAKMDAGLIIILDLGKVIDPGVAKAV